MLQDQIQASLAHTAEQLACYEDERCAAEADLLSYKEAYLQASAALVAAEDARASLALQVEAAEADKWKAEVQVLDVERKYEEAAQAAQDSQRAVEELRGQLAAVSDKLWLSVHALEEAQVCADCCTRNGSRCGIVLATAVGYS